MCSAPAGGLLITTSGLLIRMCLRGRPLLAGLFSRCYSPISIKGSHKSRNQQSDLPFPLVQRYGGRLHVSHVIGNSQASSRPRMGAIDRPHGAG
ncbi:hypothetical protein COMA2_270027 [Candidatus Nitrospira nitrificans]|uniref:Uncharacterized protein n=1 Tax=Candidatus Nitrospira nitrificans TaxID=1742973 RepID=A0A0S4LJD0_9BACT|nr:hypothetical protein COMA2_270027 [Candidatus Nitrospira nitrificans]